MTEQKAGFRCEVLDGIGQFLCFTCHIACGDDDERIGFVVRVLEVESGEEDTNCRENRLF